MAEYSAQEYTDMVIVYGVAGENARAASRLYAERFPGRERHPDYSTILRCIQHARETGSLLPTPHRVGGRRNINANYEERILQAFDDNPRNSIRRASNTLALSTKVIHRVLSQNGLRAYHFQRVQQLRAGDAEQRVYFCQGLLAQCRRNASFPDRILWTDEATFTPNGVFNCHNYVLWADENPHAIREGAFQYRWNINVWAGIKADRIIGPYFLPPRLTGNNYAGFLENKLPALLEEIPLREREELIFQHDGAPARQILDARYLQSWMGRGGPIIWPARSPDLNVLDFFVWGHIKAEVEHMRDANEEQVREAILAAFASIPQDMAHRATRNIARRAELCLREQGRHFEQFLH